MGERVVDVAVDGDVVVDGVCEGDGVRGFRRVGDVECFDRGGFGDGDGLSAGEEVVEEGSGGCGGQCKGGHGCWCICFGQVES